MTRITEKLERQVAPAEISLVDVLLDQVVGDHNIQGKEAVLLKMSNPLRFPVTMRVMEMNLGP